MRLGTGMWVAPKEVGGDLGCHGWVSARTDRMAVRGLGRILRERFRLVVTRDPAQRVKLYDSHLRYVDTTSKPIITLQAKQETDQQ